MKFRKKPVVVEAVQWKNTTESFEEISKIATKERPIAMIKCADCMQLEIQTLEGNMRANEGDWIIKGVANEFYPCKPDIFEKTYEKVED